MWIFFDDKLRSPISPSLTAFLKQWQVCLLKTWTQTQRGYECHTTTTILAISWYRHDFVSNWLSYIKRMVKVNSAVQLFGQSKIISLILAFNLDTVTQYCFSPTFVPFRTQNEETVMTAQLHDGRLSLSFCEESKSTPEQIVTTQSIEKGLLFRSVTCWFLAQF